MARLANRKNLAEAWSATLKISSGASSGHADDPRVAPGIFRKRRLTKLEKHLGRAVTFIAQAKADDGSQRNPPFRRRLCETKRTKDERRDEVEILLSDRVQTASVHPGEAEEGGRSAPLQ